jgi:hypothetical protein
VVRSTLRRCPYCGSEKLVWDHERGYLVCMNCGAVLEPLIDESHGKEAILYVHGSVSLKMARAPAHYALTRKRMRTITPPKRVILFRERKPFEKRKNIIDPIPLEGLPSYEEFEHLFRGMRVSGSIKIALFYYLIFKIIGIREKEAVSAAASKIGVSERYLGKTIRSLKGELRGILEKLGEEIAKRRSRVGSLRYSQEATRANLRGSLGEDKEQIPPEKTLQKSA